MQFYIYDNITRLLLLTIFFAFNLMTSNLISFAYLLLAFLGALLPTLANIDFVRTYGNSFDVFQFIQLANANPAAASISRDLIVGASAVTFWMIVENRRLQMKHFWIVLCSMFLIAFAFAAPFFLFLRERRLIETGKK